ncbi:MAG: response regulator transcription factor [Planctomycetes bacterium]|nr:response regulator transcription factor [Planctomycetota bacterium]
MTSAAPVIRAVVVSDDRLFCEGLRRICATDPSLTVVGEANLGVVREVLRTTLPHIVVADARVDGALGLCKELQREDTRPWVVLVAAEADDDWAVRALEAGARGILPKTATAEDLVKAIRVVHEGQIWARKQTVARVVTKLATLSRMTHAAEALLAQRLSPREQEIARHVASGLSNQEIADRLSISEATVKAHLTHIFQKLGVRDRTQLAAHYHRTQLPSAG